MIRVPFIAKGLLLREFSYEDIPAITKIASNPSFSFYSLASYAEPTHVIWASAEALVEKAIRMQESDRRTGIRENYKLAIARPEEPAGLLGYVAFDEWSELNGEERDIGYFTDPAYQKQGIASRASEALLSAFFRLTSYDVVWATVHPDNTPSRRVLEKLGYREVDRLSKIVHGGVEPRLKMVLHRNDLLPQRWNGGRLAMDFASPSQG